MTYPLAMRRHIIKTQEKEKLSFRQTATRFGIALKTLQRWHFKIEPELTRNRPFKKIDIEAFKKDIENHPDDYQYERARRFGVSQNSIHNALVHLNVTRKKNAEPSKSKRGRTVGIYGED